MQKHTFKRVLKAGYLSFRRNDWLSTATVLILVMVLFVMGNLLFLGAFAGTVLNNFESKIDISVYFKPDAPEPAILSVQKDLQSLPDVADVAYISKDQALAQFRQKHQANATILTALDEIGENPLEATLNVHAKNPSQYSSISKFLDNKSYDMVDKVNYFENQDVINRFGSILGTVRGSGAIALLILSFVAILVAFNTIRLAIYTMREEIGIMRLVGASTWFVRGPFLIVGVFYGVIAAVIATLLFFPITWLLSPKLLTLVPEFDLFKYFQDNLLQFFGLMLASGIGLGVISSFIAIRKYLKV